ncbi:sulfite reductase flavoprotein subunit alpha [Pseudomonas sp. B21-040]|jgi:sulfite reductase (NADPH) flavoprotein alpha-component|uniref:diflavin oxidoreductase n=1 Tax=unclassified Pseudomonas TaxID=196821 RepID=UPI001CBC7704|nr:MULTISPECIES: sulfite reductase flavoprotein subunit alpha [unclassified Pseudomonas]UVL38745.1 sulfite reductase flavoprotein subunit alpha [Pseudomonas sp. B21-040]
MPGLIERIVIGYGSESGNARGLTQRLLRLPCVQPYALAVQDLNALELETLTTRDLLIVVCSSFGDGEPPGNADRFLDQLIQCEHLSSVPYAIFGLGDTAYPTFCGFTKSLDAALLQKGAAPWINRVDADTDFEGFFETWCATLEAVLKGDRRAGTTLQLQVTAYGENAAWPARVISRTRLNATAPYAWQVRLDIEGSGIKYRAGDNLYVLAQNDPQLLAQIGQWFGRDDAHTLLATKELRQLGKSLLRDMARVSQHDTLKTLLKVSNRKELEGYLYGKDLLDVLSDFCEPGQMSLEELAEWLPDVLPRAYSIASHDQPHYVDLCIREIAYQLADRPRIGTATGHLAGKLAQVQVFARSNVRFHLPRQADHPVVLIGTGTGIAPLIALLEQIEQQSSPAQTCLIFGDRRRASDFLYQPRLEKWQETGVLDQLITAFSRDADRRYYVQDAMLEHGAYLWALLSQGAHVYVCGNKSHLERAIDEALVNIAMRYGHLAEEDAQQFVADLSSSDRVHKELY